MSQAVEKKQKRRWRRTTWVSLLSGLTIAGSLLYWDQVAWLYILSTLGVTVLMLIVAFSDLQDGEEVSTNATGFDDQTATRDVRITDTPATRTAPAGKRLKKAR